MAPRSPETSERKFGYNPGVSTVEVEIRSNDVNLAYPTENVSMEIISDDAADTGKALGTLTLVSAIATDVAVVDGLSYTGVTGVKADNTEFSVDTSDTAAAADLADSINNDVRAGITVPTAVIVATSAAGVVTISVDGVIGNLVDISSVDSTITASAATLTDVGTGARSALIKGIQINSAGEYVAIEETVFLQGVTAVPLIEKFYRINRAHIVKVGTDLVNAGLVTIRVVSGSVVQTTIPIGEGQSQQTNYTGPSNNTLIITSMDFSVSQGSGNAIIVLIKFWVKLRDESWRMFGSKSFGNEAFNVPLLRHELEFPADSDFKVTGIKLTGTGDGRVECAYSYIES